MNNFTFYSPTEFLFGKNVELQVAELIKKQGATNVLLVFGGGSIFRSGLLDRIEDILESANIPFSRLGGIQPNPIDEKVYQGIELCRKDKIDLILAIGGGSVIDTAKAIAVGAPYQGDFWDFFEGKAVPQSALKVGVVLTIPAAGSEGSGNSVITKVSTLQKLSLRTPELLRPVFSIMNPELTYTLSNYQTAVGVVDMMAHIMERYFSNTEEVELTNSLCEATLRVIRDEALRVKDDPEHYGARANIMWSGTLAHNGLLGVGREEDWASHFMEHEISALYGVAHGAGLAVVFPAWMTYAVDHNVDKLVQYAVKVWNIPEEGDKKEIALQGIDALKSFLVSIGMPTTFSDLGIKDPDIDEMVTRLHQNKGAIIGNYIPLSATETRAIYELMK
ncbi:MAG: iron-containing alcohol dehydrogenase [Bacteroidales bacterium]|nr:iron-containing alcohol dehydrogenase [Bacteroidales bacterium]